MKILLTHGYFISEDPKEQIIMRPYAPLGILYISAFLEQHGFNNEVFDSTFSSFDKFQAYVLACQPEVIAIYTNLMTKINVVKMIHFIKNEPQLKQCKIALGGPEVTHHADNFIKTGADFIVVGEGEQTMLELIKAIGAGSANYENINGLIYKNGAEIEKNTARELIKDISLLPFPNRNKIDISQYINVWRRQHGYGMISVSTMRGCPYTCKWCSRAVYGGSYRRRKPIQVAEEMLYLKQTYAPDMIWFVDDVFTIHHKWLKEFSDAVLDFDALIPYEIISRADRLNEEVILNLKKSGCKRIWIGAESGSQRIIDLMDRRVSVIETRAMIKLAQKHGIEAGTFIMLGYPGETKHDIKETIEHLVECNPSVFTITVAYPIKGTPLYNEIEKNIITKNFNWETNTDRDIDFKRTQTKAYYEHAVSWVINSVELKTKSNSTLKKLKLFAKKSKAEFKMFLESRKVASLAE